MAIDLTAFFDPATSTVTYLVWDVATGEERATLNALRPIVWNVAFSPDGTLLASASDDRTVGGRGGLAAGKGSLAAKISAMMFAG